ncbi:MAG: hypothetical protein RLY35_1924 [Bacteroidota bacterium]|jgi:hypothetical protein
MSQLELFRDALLVALVAILVYILYKRLLHLMAKQNVQAKYPSIDAETIFQDNVVSIQLELQQSMPIKVSVLNGGNELIENLKEGELGAGKHDFSFSMKGREQGKYAFEIITPHEKAKRYFTIG